MIVVTRSPRAIIVFADLDRLAAAGDQTIGYDAGQRRGTTHHPIGQRPDGGHVDVGIVAFILQIVRQPRQNEIPHVVGAKQAEEVAPRGTFRHDTRNAGSVGHVDLLRDLVARREEEPRNEPEQAGNAHGPEEDTPSVSGHEQAAQQHAERGTELRARVDQAIGQAAMAFTEVGDQDFGVARDKPPIRPCQESCAESVGWRKSR